MMKSYRPEEIVRLARSLLQEERGAEIATTLARREAARRSPALRLAALRGFEAGTNGGALLAAQLLEELRRPINRYETVELEAQLFYAARKTGEGLRTLRRKLREALEVKERGPLTALDYLRIRDWLWEKIEA